MSDQVSAALISALTAGAVTFVGWFVLHGLSMRKEIRTSRQRERLHHLRCQIEELYGPLYGLAQQSALAYEIAKQKLPTKDGEIDIYEIKGERESNIYRFFLDSYFIPITQRMTSLLCTKVYLLESVQESDVLPESFQRFLGHQIYQECLNRLLKETGESSEEISGLGWPKDFSAELEDTLRKLRKQYNEYKDELAGSVSKKTNAIFELYMPSAQSVGLAGSFNFWQEEPMNRSGKGVWQLQVDIPTGKNLYKFIADGKWLLDPRNNQVERDEHGNTNSVIHV